MMPSRSPKVFFTFLVLSSVCILWIVSSSWNDGHIWFQPQQTRGSDPDMEQATLQATAGRPTSTDNYSPVVSAEVQRSPDLSSQEENVFTYPSSEVENLFMRVAARNNCGSVLSLNESGWRSNDVLRLKTAEIDYQRMNQLLECGPPLDEHFLKAQPTTKVYDFERPYLTRPPLTNRSLASSEFKSVVYLLSERKTFEVGEKISIRVDVKDGRGQPKGHGGDEVRVWLKAVENSKRSIAADVLDFGNGSYLATGLVPWPGEVKVMAGLAHTSEYIRAILQTHRVIKSLATFVGLFRNKIADEATPCSYQPHIPGHHEQEVCNLTKVNGSPWFCGRPIKTQLQCSDYLGARRLRDVDDWRLPVTKAEMAELDRTHKKPRIRLIGSLIKLTVTAGKPPGAFTLPTIPCHKIQPNQTWTRQSPNGFLFNDKWNFLSCQRARSRNCFQNLTLYVLGDSNSRHHYNSWCKLINAVQRIKQTIPAWHSPLECSKPSINFFSRWDPHASPFTVSMGVWTLLGTQIIPSSHVIDSIPAKTPGRVLLVLHHYFHLTMHHVTAFHNMVIASRDAVARLLDRNPNVQVLVQGPHVTYVGWDKHYVAGDGLARFMEELLVQEYRPLRDRVVYLRTWDLTLASENFPYHPRLQRTIDDLILDLMCGR